jgi:hypothetical protein
VNASNTLDESNIDTSLGSNIVEKSLEIAKLEIPTAARKRSLEEKSQQLVK